MGATGSWAFVIEKNNFILEYKCNGKTIGIYT